MCVRSVKSYSTEGKYSTFRKKKYIAIFFIVYSLYCMVDYSYVRYSSYVYMYILKSVSALPDERDEKISRLLK